MANYWLILIGVAGAALAACAAYLLFRRGPDERERERLRLAELSRNGRITGGRIDGLGDRLVYYSYEIGGVGYAAAQDLSAFPELSGAMLATLSGSVTIRYSRATPSNSMVYCESWCGLPLSASTKDNLAQGRITESDVSGAA
ncbi:MAG: hypothetical protein U5J83_18010 [Bryobacterales bacterium]|nr:hypothetical protein [Bryobacterales bacterium]